MNYFLGQFILVMLISSAVTLLGFAAVEAFVYLYPKLGKLTMAAITIPTVSVVYAATATYIRACADRGEHGQTF